MAQDARLGEIVGQIYDSVHDIELLRPAMCALSQELRGVVSHYVHLNIADQSVIKSFISDPAYAEGDAAYADYYSRIDPRARWFGTGELGIWRADYERFDDGFVRKNEFYNDYLFKYDVRHMIVSTVGGKSGKPQALSFGRPMGADRFSPDDYAILNYISPHLVRASELRTEMDAIRAQEEAARTELSRLPYGTVWVDSSLRIITMNDVAADILKVADGIKIKDGSLHAGNPKAMGELAEALSLATQPVIGQGRWLAVRRSIRSTPLIVSVIPARRGEEEGKPAAMVILHDPARHVFPHAEQMMTLLGLTAAEANLAQALVENETLESFSEKFNVAKSTARSHLKSVFAKTGTCRQAELVRTLLLVFPGWII